MDSRQIKEFLKSWTDGVIEIGKIYIEEGDYVNEASNFLDEHYAFGSENVLFKPTFTKEKVFRNNKKDALSYFVRGEVAEDNGFALKPWELITLDELNTLIEKNLSLVMGTLLFKPYNDNLTTKVAFTFVIKKIGNSLKIRAHHSSPVN